MEGCLLPVVPCVSTLSSAQPDSLSLADVIADAHSQCLAALSWLAFVGMGTSS